MKLPLFRHELCELGSDPLPLRRAPLPLQLVLLLPSLAHFLALLLMRFMRLLKLSMVMMMMGTLVRRYRQEVDDHRPEIVPTDHILLHEHRLIGNPR